MTAAIPIPALDHGLMVERARAGDEAAFKALYDVFAPRVLALALRMTRSPAAAEDALQEVFLRAWLALPRFRGDCAFSTWLHQIAVRLLIDRHRAAPPEAQDERVLELVSAAPAGTTLDIERAVAALPERARLVMLLTIAGHGYEEIATIMGTEIGTVKAQLHRARRLVREALA